MSVKVTRIAIDLRPLVYHPGSPARRQMMVRGLAVKSRAQQPAPVDTGRLRASGSTHLIEDGTELRSRITFRARHAWWVHKGTGLYGPRRRVIRPIANRGKRGKNRKAVLRFVVDGKVVFARSVKGMRPRRFLTQAVKEVIGKTPRRRRAKSTGDGE